ncbi:MAG: acyloxyacyl hydrolase [bacterium]
MVIVTIILLGHRVSNAQRDTLQKVPSSLAFNAGVFGIFDPALVQGQFECEFYPNLKAWFFYPFAGAFFTTNASTSVFAGVTIPIQVNKRLLVRLSFAPGLYKSSEIKSDLGFFLEFRTSLKLAYVFNDQSRLGIQFAHISNANLNKENPGVEALVVSYEIPLRTD